MLTSLVIGLAAGLAATPHCLGMCGGFPLHLTRIPAPAGSRPSGDAVWKLLLFVTGKCFTYVFLGALASALGVILLKNTSFAHVAPAMRIGAGAVTLLFGLTMLGLRRPRRKKPGGGGSGADTRSGDREEGGNAHRDYGGIWTAILGSLLARPTATSSFVLGLGVGFLPCPLPIAMLAVAAASHDVPQGIALMAGVGLGTAPGLLAVGLLGMGLNWKLKRWGMRAAGVMVSVIGVLTICRAIGGMPRSHMVDTVVPPCCQGHVDK